MDTKTAYQQCIKVEGNKAVASDSVHIKVENHYINLDTAKKPQTNKQLQPVIPLTATEVLFSFSLLTYQIFVFFSWPFKDGAVNAFE